MRQTAFVLLAAALLTALPAAGTTPQPTATRLSVSPAGQSAISQSVTLTASVSDAANQPVLYGTVSFFDGTIRLGVVQLIAHPGSGASAGTAVFRTVALRAGGHSLSARFDPLPAYSPSASIADAYHVAPIAAPASSVTWWGYATRNRSGTYTLDAYTLASPTSAPLPAQAGTITFQDVTAGVSLGSVPVTQFIDAFFGGVNFEAPPSIPSLPAVSGATGDFAKVGEDEAIIPQVGSPQAIVLPGPTSLTVATATGSNSIASGDFNGDGNLDVVFKPDSAAVPLQLFLGKGDGTFRAPLAVTGHVGKVLTGDFNGDGKLDLLISAPTSYVSFGNGDGTFQPAIVASSLDPGPQTFVADLNHDGISDLITSNGVQLGKGDGTFGTQSPWSPTEKRYGSFTVGDLDGDGNIDIAGSLAGAIPPGVPCCASWVASSVDSYFGTGSGTFKSRGALALGLGYNLTAPLILLADVDQDGNVDLFVSSPGVPGDVGPAYSLYSGDGRGGFGAHFGSLQTSLFVNPIAFGSFDSLPTVLAGSAGGNIYLLQLVTGETDLEGKLTDVTIPGLNFHTVVPTYSGDVSVAASSASPLSLLTTTGGITLSRTSHPFTSNPGVPQSGRIYVTNNYSQAVSFSPAIVGSPAFQLTKTCPVIQPKATCGFQVTYQPAQVGTDSGTLSLNPMNGPAGDSPSVSLTGLSVSPAVIVSRTSHPFQTTVGTPVSGRIYITNYLRYTLNSHPLVSGDPGFSVTNDCSAIPAFQTCGLNVVFTPQKAESVNGQISLRFINAPALTPSTVTLTGKATLPPVLVSTTSLTLYAEYGTSISTPVSITNYTSQAISLNPVLSGGSDVSLTSTCTTIAPQKTCTIQVTYTPVANNFAGSLAFNFVSPPPGTPSAVALQAFPTYAQINVNEGGDSGSVTLYLQTNIGTFQSSVISVLNGTPHTLTLNPVFNGDPSFTIYRTCSSIPAYGTCVMDLDFQPTALGSFSAILNVNPTNLGPGDSQSVPLVTYKGTGVPVP